MRPEPLLRRLRAGIFLLLALILVLQPLASPGAAQEGPDSNAAEKAQALLETLTPEERVGQLFLVTFEGSDVGPESNIADLIDNYHVGGVVLMAEKDNFNVETPLGEQTLNLSRDLQLIGWSASQQPRPAPLTGEPFAPAFIPLFVSISQEGDQYPFDQIRSQLTPLPNQMAIGATWNPLLSEQVGSLLGRELSALGINMLLGPSLDVLETPHTGSAIDLGTRTFGGDPFWVGEMGSAYIQGVHTGSAGRVAVVAKHFPGHGGSDRLPEEEVSTVRKSLEQLKNFDLVPFFAATGSAASPEATADALLVSHIRYQGFQGNIRATTRPVSFDPQAFNALLELEPIQNWRSEGGVMVSDNLGSRAIRRFYSLTNQEFDLPRRVALTAFLAGNDLLYIADFTSGELDAHTAAVRTLEFFAQKYRDEPVFAQRVDQSVLRILTLKFKLYENFSLGLVLSPPEGLENIGLEEQVTFDVARQAATLISPSLTELDDTAPDPPNLNDRIVFITDTRTASQCSQCPEEPLIGMRALEDVVLRRYGPQAGGQITPNNIQSHSLASLQEMLDFPDGDWQLEDDLGRAHWIVFAMVDNGSSQANYNTLVRFLDERPDLFLQKRLIVFAFNAPYFLDATTITKLTAYYALYSKTPPFIDVAAYLLFRELRPSGALPVSVPGVYDLNAALFPDAGQIISLELDLPRPEAEGVTPQPLPTPTFSLGDVIPIRTGVILDFNGHPVPDNTPVKFITTMPVENGLPRQVETIAETLDGVARTRLTITNAGVMEVRAETETTQQSDVLRFDIRGDNVTLVATPTDLPTPTPTATPTATPQAPVSVDEEPPPSLPLPQVSDWIMALLVTAAIAWSAYRLTLEMGQARWGVRGGFLALIGGLAGYSYLALQMPGSEILMGESVSRGVFFGTLIGAGLGLLATWLWQMAASGPGQSGKRMQSDRLRQ